MTLSAPNRLNLVQKDVPGTKEETNLRSLFEHIKSSEIVNGRLIEDINITTAGTTVNHGLGRIWSGWFVVDNTADVRVWSVPSADEKKYLMLDASGTATIAIWVF